MASIVKMRNPRKRKATKRRNPSTPVKRAVANPRRAKRAKRRNPSTALAARNPTYIRKANPKRKSRRRRNGITRRNGIFSGMGATFKTVALGGGGAIVTGIVSRGVMTVLTPIVGNLPVPNWLLQSLLEIGIAIVPLKMVSEKIFSADNASKIVAGGLIKAGLTAVNGALPAVADFNPLANSNIIGNGQGQIADDIYQTDTLAGAYDDGNQYEDYAETTW